MKHAKLAASLICTVMLAIFAVFVWPTRYKYEHTVFTAEAHQQVLIRIDRFTGEISYPDAVSGEWKSLRKNPENIFDRIREQQNQQKESK